jgi:hypothetical protein
MNSVIVREQNSRQFLIEPLFLKFGLHEISQEKAWTFSGDEQLIPPLLPSPRSNFRRGETLFIQGQGIYG